ncbi:uncharacterized protein LOC125497509 isoform X1 [Beta vulgaris subsp. vulgaris]|uniref:uncharacterized protein LOC125497509 isoform X1 n=1 Tax=Beta vulgaris subsp. vulgaris TaxID=3555 RepID=UPI002036CB7E|nr:uncharacterized protein LOC125497509 isoform X1 [Beta vulgaris subsp. vulgaris]
MVRYHTFSDLKEVRSISEPILVAGFRFRNTLKPSQEGWKWRPLNPIIALIVALANLLPVDDSIDELDSYMYQTVSFFTLLYTDTSSYFMCSYLSCYFYESRETFLLDSKCKETLSTFRLPSLS